MTDHSDNKHQYEQAHQGQHQPTHGIIGASLAAAASVLVILAPNAAAAAPVEADEVDENDAETQMSADDAESSVDAYFQSVTTESVIDPFDALPPLLDYYGIDTATSKPAAEIWEAGLVHLDTYAEFRQTLDELNRWVGGRAGVRIDTTTRAVLNGVAISSMTPDQARDIVASTGENSDLAEHLIKVARVTAHTTSDTEEAGSSQVSPDSRETIDVLEEIAETQREMVEALKDSQEPDGAPGWSTLLDQLNPVNLAGVLLNTIITLNARAVYERGKQIVVSVLKPTRKTVAKPPLTPEEIVKVWMDDVYSDALERARREAHAEVARVLRNAGLTKEGADTTPIQDLLALSYMHDHDPETVARARTAVTEGMTTALAEQPGLRDPVRLANRLSTSAEHLIDALV